MKKSWRREAAAATAREDRHKANKNVLRARDWRLRFYATTKNKGAREHAAFSVDQK
jgi:hypothetical protein